jgi:hypothetical protein
MKAGDVVFAAYRNSLVEVLSVDKNNITIIVYVLEDLYHSVIVDEKQLVKIGELQ